MHCRGAGGGQRVVVVGEREAVIGGAGEGRGDDDDRAGGGECAHDTAAEDLAGGAREGDGEAGGRGGRGGREVGARQGDDLEAAAEGDGGAGRGGLAQRDVRDGPAPAHDAYAALPPPCEIRDALPHVVAAGDFEDVRAHGVPILARDDHGWFRFVLRPGRAASRLARRLARTGRRFGPPLAALPRSAWHAAAAPLLLVRRVRAPRRRWPRPRLRSTLLDPGHKHMPELRRRVALLLLVPLGLPRLLDVVAPHDHPRCNLSHFIRS